MPEAEQPQYDDVTLDQADAAFQQANEEADDHGELTIDWRKVEDDPVQRLSEAALSACVDQSFTTEHEGETIELKLEQVVPLGATVDLGAAAGGTQDQFSAIFHCPGEALPEGLYALRNETLGEIHLYLDPVGPGDDGDARPHVEAVFS